MAGQCVTVDLSPACVNLTGIRAGDRNQMTVTVTADGAPFNLTGLTLTTQARETPDDAAIALTGTVTVTDATGGKLTVAWPGAAVATLINGTGTWNGVWDLQAKPVSGDPTTLMAGTFTAVMDVTRP